MTQDKIFVNQTDGSNGIDYDERSKIYVFNDIKLYFQNLISVLIWRKRISKFTYTPWYFFTTSNNEIRQKIFCLDFYKNTFYSLLQNLQFK